LRTSNIFLADTHRNMFYIADTQMNFFYLWQITFRRSGFLLWKLLHEQNFKFPSMSTGVPTVHQRKIKQWAASTVNIANKKKKSCCYRWWLSCYSAPVYWLVRNHMRRNNETVSKCHERNFVKTITSNGKQFTVTSKTLTTVVAWCCRWNLSAFFHRLDPFVLCIANH